MAIAENSKSALAHDDCEAEGGSVDGRRTLYNVGLLLATCYSASIGGTATLAGTGPNIVLTEQLRSCANRSESTAKLVYRHDANSLGITYLSWMLFALPVAITCLLACYMLLYCMYILPDRWCQRQLQAPDGISSVMRERYRSLGPISSHERLILFLFVLLIILWLTRAPDFMPGWSRLLPRGYTSDAQPTMLIAILLFAIPRRMSFDSPPLLQWRQCEGRLSWGTVMLLGGGYAMADAVSASGLSALLAKSLVTVTGSWPPIAFTFALTTMICFLTEFSSNVATALVFLPVLLTLAESAGTPLLEYALPTTFACSYAFMLPAATPPNAIAFSTGRMSVAHMARTGIFLNVLCVCISVLYTTLFAPVVFYDAYHTFNSTNVTLTPL